MSYGVPWANASNTPFRLFKSYVQEGEIATPFVVHWPAAARSMRSRNRDTDDNCNRGRICRLPMDIVATCCDIAGMAISLGFLEGDRIRRYYMDMMIQTDYSPYFGSIRGIAQCDEVRGSLCTGVMIVK